MLFQYMLLLRGATTKSYLLSSEKCFNTCSSCEEQLAISGLLVRIKMSFNTCSSCEEQHVSGYYSDYAGGFNTCSSCEEQPGRTRSFGNATGFNTCSSCEEQLSTPEIVRTVVRFQYMLLLRGATSLPHVLPKSPRVSIHAPLARSNSERLQEMEEFGVSIHAPLARSNPG